MCEHEKTFQKPEIGFDCWNGGEEIQHMEVCADCGAKRIVAEQTWFIDMSHSVAYGEWY